MKFRTMTLTEAKQWADEIDRLSDEEFQGRRGKWRSNDIELDPSYTELRKTILTTFEASGGYELAPRRMYPVDVAVGLALYEYLNDKGFTLCDASNDDLWRYLTIKVFPDITFCRYPDPEKDSREHGSRINKKRFYSHTRRIWLKTLWWYVYLSWQGSKEATRSAIEANGSNVISHFIETPGKGYRVDLYRALMKRYSESNDKSDKLFRSVAKLNGAECRNTEPALLPGGVSEYCKILFSKVESSGLNNE